MKFSNFFIAIIISVLFFSCDDSEDEGGFGIRISPEANYLVREGGSVVNFTIKIESNEDLRRYRITESINEFTSTVLKDENISGQFYSDWFDYTVPDTFQFGNNQIELIFSTFDVKGDEMKRAKIIYVNIEERPLEEFGSYTMFSSISNQFDAFDLLSGTPKYSSDSTSHIIDLTKSNALDTLSKSWTSPNPEIKFVRFNNFDYGNATDLAVETAYETGIKDDTIRNLRNDNILLSKIEDNYVAIRLLFVTDENGSANDKYIFSVKR